MFWDRNSVTMKACAAIIGCQVDSGMVNRWNDLERAGAFKGCNIVQDYLKVWLKVEYDLSKQPT